MPRPRNLRGSRQPPSIAVGATEYDIVVRALVPGSPLLLAASVGVLQRTARSDVRVLGRVALWLHLVHAAAAPPGIPGVLELALIA